MVSGANCDDDCNVDKDYDNDRHCFPQLRAFHRRRPSHFRHVEDEALQVEHSEMRPTKEVRIRTRNSSTSNSKIDNKESSEDMMDDLLNHFDAEVERRLCRAVFPRARSRQQRRQELNQKVLNHAYLKDLNFRMTFLRAERFQPKPAAERFVRYMKIKATLFGREALVRDIVQADLDQEDVIALQSGFVEIVATKSNKDTTCMDNGTQQHHGQSLIVVKPAMLCKIRSVDNACRAIFYMAERFLRKNNQAQKMEFIGILYEVGVKRNEFRNLVWALAKLRQSLPWYFSSLHVCTDTKESFRPMEYIERKLMEAYEGAQVQYHFGTHMEVQYKLMAQGLPIDALLMTPRGEFKMDRHWTSLRRLREEERNVDETQPVQASEESSSSTASTAESHEFLKPEPMDVLVGDRGRRRGENQGNVLFRRMVALQTELYNSAQPFERIELAEAIVQKVRKTGRFLKHNPNLGSWRELDDHIAYLHVTNTFRARQTARKVPQWKMFQH